MHLARASGLGRWWQRPQTSQTAGRGTTAQVRAFIWRKAAGSGESDSLQTIALLNYRDKVPLRKQISRKVTAEILGAFSIRNDMIVFRAGFASVQVVHERTFFVPVKQSHDSLRPVYRLGTVFNSLLSAEPRSLKGF